MFSELSCSKVVYWASLVAQRLKHLPAMWETWVRSLGWEDPLEEGMATHSSIPAWKNPMDRGVWWATVHGVTKGQTRLSNFTFKVVYQGQSRDLKLNIN